MHARWNKNYLMQGPHWVMTEICGSHGMEKMPFQPPFHGGHGQTDGTSQASHKHWDFPCPPTVSASSSLTCNPSYWSSLSIFSPSLPDLCLHAVFSCWAPASMFPAVCSRRKNKQRGLTAKENGRDHQVLQAASFHSKESFGSNKDRTSWDPVSRWDSSRTLKMLFCQAVQYPEWCQQTSVLGSGNQALHLSLRWWESPGMATTEKTSPERSPQSCGSPCSEV